MAVGPLDGRAGGRPDVGEQHRRADPASNLTEILVVPRRVGALEYRWLGSLAVPTDSESVAVGRGDAQAGVQALIDDRVHGTEEQVFSEDRLP